MADEALRLTNVRVQRITQWPDGPSWATVELTGAGDVRALQALNQFFNASWLLLPDLSFLQDALALDVGEGMSLREEGWAMRQCVAPPEKDGENCGNGDWVLVAASYGDVDALVSWLDWQAALKLVQCHQQLAKRYPCGEVSYRVEGGFRVRLHA